MSVHSVTDSPLPKGWRDHTDVDWVTASWSGPNRVPVRRGGETDVFLGLVVQDSTAVVRPLGEMFTLCLLRPDSDREEPLQTSSHQSKKKKVIELDEGLYGSRPLPGVL